MNRYRISPENRKCSYEVTEYVKGDKKITCTTVWRYALFDVESDTKPVLNEGDDIYSTLDNVEFVEAADGDNYYDYENMTDEEIDKIEEFLNERAIYELEEYGWMPADTTWYFDCPVEIEEIKESV